jgi:hypothetical protein
MKAVSVASALALVVPATVEGTNLGALRAARRAYDVQAPVLGLDLARKDAAARSRVRQAVTLAEQDDDAIGEDTARRWINTPCRRER